MLFNMKLRKFLDKHKWPLVTRGRYQKLKDNMQAELDHAEETINVLRSINAKFRVKLHEAQKNDQRDPETGRYVGADKPE